MKKYLLLYAVVVTASLVYTIRHSRQQTRRLTQNQTALLTQVSHYRTQAGQQAASALALRLRVGEFETLRRADAEQIRALGIKLRRLEATAHTATATAVELRAELRDTVVLRSASGRLPASPQEHDTLRAFRWCDAWVSVEGLIDRDSVQCRVQSVDTLRQVVHRVPRRFWFIRWGTKAIRQEVISTNPHTRIVHTEYLKIEGRHK